MFKEREELEKALDDIISKKNHEKKISNHVKNEFNKVGLSNGDFNEIWSKRIKLNEIDMSTLFVLTKSLFHITQDKNINLNEWFTETEIEDGNEYRKELYEERLNFPAEPLMVENVLMGKDDQYLAYMDIRTIKLWYDSGIIKYNYDTQRNPRYVQEKETGDLIKTPNVNPESVDEISKAIEDNKFITNCITLNILNGEIKYTNKRDLIIIDGIINPIDGFHRVQGMIKALGENPNVNYITEVRFTVWDVQKCKSFIGQEDKRNKINKRYMASAINFTKWGNKITNQLNDGESDLNGKIVTDIMPINKHKAFTLFDVVSDTIDELYVVKTNSQATEVGEWITKFIDYIIGLFPEVFIDDIEISKAKTVLNAPAIFVGYLTLSKKLQGVNDWQSKLDTILFELDFDIKNPIWTELNIVKNNKQVVSFSKTKIKPIINYFNTVL